MGQGRLGLAVVLAAATLGLGCGSSSTAPAAIDAGADAGSTDAGFNCESVPRVVVNHAAEYIDTPTTWAGPGFVHVVSGTTNVVRAGVLTLEPCARVELAADATLQVGSNASGGALLARGTAERPILLTGKAGARWGYLSVEHPATADLAYVTIEGGGGDAVSAHNATLIVRGDNARPLKRGVKVDHVTVRGSKGHGVWVREQAGFAAPSTDLRIENSGEEALIVSPSVVATLPSLALSGNARDVVTLDTDDGSQGTYALLDDVTIRDLGYPYDVGTSDGDSLLVGSEDPVSHAIRLTTLTVEAGVTLRFRKGGALKVGFSTDADGSGGREGALIVRGTAGSPVRFTSANATPKAGDWVGVYFSGGAHASSSIDHAIIEYGGANSSTGGFTCAPEVIGDDANVLIVGGPATVDLLKNTEIRFGAKSGIARGWTLSQGPGVNFVAAGHATVHDVAGCTQAPTRDLLNACPIPRSCD